MQPTIDDTLTELGRLYMETIILKRALGNQQHETARMATEVGSLRKRHVKLRKTAMKQEENLIALNERLMRRAAPREIEHGSGGKNE